MGNTCLALNEKKCQNANSIPTMSFMVSQSEKKCINVSDGKKSGPVVVTDQTNSMLRLCDGKLATVVLGMFTTLDLGRRNRVTKLASQCYVNLAKLGETVSRVVSKIVVNLLHV